ncbi:hypothetical protein HK099_000309, partial [Clydaea vesicula]
ELISRGANSEFPNFIPKNLISISELHFPDNSRKVLLPFTPLCAASVMEHFLVMEYLCKQNITSVNSYGDIALFFTAMAEKVESIKLLMKLGSKIQGGVLNPLTVACRLNNEDLLKNLLFPSLSETENNNLVDLTLIRDALIESLKLDSKNLVQLLIEKFIEKKNFNKNFLEQVRVILDLFKTYSLTDSNCSKLGLELFKFDCFDLEEEFSFFFGDVTSNSCDMNDLNEITTRKTKKLKKKKKKIYNSCNQYLKNKKEDEEEQQEKEIVFDNKNESSEREEETEENLQCCSDFTLSPFVDLINSPLQKFDDEYCTWTENDWTF